MADSLALSVKTIEAYCRRIREKLAVRDSRDLSSLASEWFLAEN
ncbi:MAG: hypothetical protein IIB38_01395 [Candidatus Hydrogenedentes bacterium]|nr:hypothetical protein [Candidatus Hydrogenedentota bacterium]